MKWSNLHIGKGREGSTIYAELGTEISVENLIRGIVVSSGNDACVIVAESLSGSEEIFAEQMNSYAKEMGLLGTNYVNSSGLHNDEHYSTVQDLSILAKKLIIDFSRVIIGRIIFHILFPSVCYV